MVLRMLILVLAIGAGGGAAWLASGADRAQPAAQPAGIATAEVLVATADIGAGDVLSADRMAWQPWPRQTLNEGFVTRQARPDAIAELTGSFVNDGFAAGEPIRQARLMQTNANLMSAKLEVGKRAVAVKVTPESTAGGFILPGDRVDVILTVALDGQAGPAARTESRIIISNARVLAIDQTAVQKPEGSVLGKTATLELTPVEAERIMSAEAAGSLSLALRAVADHDATAPVERVQTVRVNRASQRSTVTIR